MTTNTAQSETTATTRSRAGRVAAVAVPTVTALVVAGSIGAGALRSGAASGLEPKSAEQILTGMQQSTVQPLSGTVVAKADLGLPELPVTADSPDLASLVSGSHTMRVWYDGPDKARLAKLGGAGETDVIRNGHDLWVWSSKDKTAVHRVIADDTQRSRTGPSEGSMPATPQEASQRILATIGKDSTVTTNAVSRVAGRDAYELVVTPKQQDTLVKNVRLAVDGETMMPLRVQVNSTKLDTPAYEVGFTDLQLGDVEDRMFSFTPPAGAKVTREDAKPGEAKGQDPATSAAKGAEKDAEHHARGKATGRAGEKDMQTQGEGWSRVTVADAGANPMELLKKAESGASASGEAQGHGGSGDLTSILQSLPETSGSWGRGRVLEGTLFSVVVADDGRIAVGAVPSSRLTAALGAAK